MAGTRCRRIAGCGGFGWLNIMRMRLGNVDRLTQLVEQAKARFPYVVFLPFLSGNPDRGGYGLFSPEGIRAYNPDQRFRAPSFQAAFMSPGYDEAAIIRDLEAILAGGMPAGATASGPSLPELEPIREDPRSVVGQMQSIALPAAVLGALFLIFKWR